MKFCTHDTTLLRDRRGAAAIEMALVLPVILLILFGLIIYGTGLALAHAVQQSANEGARAALSGLSPNERYHVASDVSLRSLVNSYSVANRDVSVVTDEDSDFLTVTVALDASRYPLLSLPFAGMVDKHVVRRASVHLVKP